MTSVSTADMAPLKLEGRVCWRHLSQRPETLEDFNAPVARPEKQSYVAAIKRWRPRAGIEGNPPMKIDGKTVRHIARLARLKIDDKQAKALEKELTSILGWIEQLNQIDTSGVPPMTGASKLKMALRPDVLNDGGYSELIVKNAPLSEDNFFVVPKVVE